MRWIRQQNARKILHLFDGWENMLYHIFPKRKLFRRVFERMCFSVKNLGFGLMRLPMQGEEVDIAELTRMVDLFLQRGFTYFDTAWGYTGGKSEKAVKTVLVDRYPRERFQLATKLPAWAGAKNAEEARAMLATSLERTGAGYFDYYLLHNLGGTRTKLFEDYGIWDFLREQKEKGVIRKLGFSFHDKADVLDGILKAHPDVDFVQLQINYADWDSPTVQSRLCYETARAHGKPIIVMEPVKGGSLANLPREAAQPMLSFAPQRSLSSWAVRFAASLEGVFMVLSGMSTLAQVEDNTSYMAGFAPLTAQELDVIKETQAALDKLDRIPCTDCRYCLKGCPKGIAIAPIFSAMNTLKVFNNLDGAKRSYGFATADVTPEACIRCGQCESVCPQHIPIISELENAARLLG